MGTVEMEEAEALGESEESQAEEDTDLALLRRYFVGKKYAQIWGENGFVDGNAVDNTQNLLGEDIEEIDVLNESPFERDGLQYRAYTLYISYNDETYAVTAEKEDGTNDAEILFTQVVISKIPNIGKYVTYEGIGYKVFAEDEENGTVDLISAQALQVNGSDINLGTFDPNAENNATDLDGDETISNFEKAVYSYNNAINTLVTACKDATGLTVDGTNVISIRSAGNTDVKYTSSGIVGTDNPGTYDTYDYQTAGAESNWYATKGYSIYNLKAGDNNYESDWSIMRKIGATNGGGSNPYYWLASRYIREEADYIYFNIRIAGVYENNGRCGFMLHASK